MKFRNLLLIAFFTLILSFSANAQTGGLRAYTFEYNDEFGGKQKSYTSLRGFDINWDAATANLLFNSFESELARERKLEPRKIFILTLKQSDFYSNVSVPITPEEVGSPRAIVFSDMLWEIAENTDFIPDYVWNEQQQKLIPVMKSLNDLGAVRIDVPLEALRGKK